MYIRNFILQFLNSQHGYPLLSRDDGPVYIVVGVLELAEVFARFYVAFCYRYEIDYLILEWMMSDNSSYSACYFYLFRSCTLFCVVLVSCLFCGFLRSCCDKCTVVYAIVVVVIAIVAIVATICLFYHFCTTTIVRIYKTVLTICDTLPWVIFRLSGQ